MIRQQNACNPQNQPVSMGDQCAAVDSVWLAATKSHAKERAMESVFPLTRGQAAGIQAFTMSGNQGILVSILFGFGCLIRLFHLAQ
jgi:hypothetical protein